MGIKGPFARSHPFQVIPQLPLQFPHVEWLLGRTGQSLPSLELLQLGNKLVPYGLTLALFVPDKGVGLSGPFGLESLQLGDYCLFLRE